MVIIMDARLRHLFLKRPLATAGLVGAIALSLGALPRQADAYALEGPKWPLGTVVNFQLELGNANRTLLDGNTSWNTAAAPALGAWNPEIQRAQFTYVNNSTAPVQSGDNVNSIAFATTFFGHSFGSSTLAVTVYHWQGSSTMTEADIIFNSNQNFNSYRGALQFGSNGYD